MPQFISTAFDLLLSAILLNQLLITLHKNFIFFDFCLVLLMFNSEKLWICRVFVCDHENEG